MVSGKAAFTAAEARGRALFETHECASCHPDDPEGAFPAFTDFRFAALGVPGDRDLGLCGPLRTDLPDRDNCGKFRTPSLRNVASRRRFFHDGSFTSLAEVVRFHDARLADVEIAERRHVPRHAHR